MYSNSVKTRQSHSADSAPGAASWGVTLSARKVGWWVRRWPATSFDLSTVYSQARGCVWACCMRRRAALAYEQIWLSIKPEVHSVSLRCKRKTVPQPEVHSMHKTLVEDWMCTSGQTNTRHYRGQRNNDDVFTLRTRGSVPSVNGRWIDRRICTKTNLAVRSMAFLHGSPLRRERHGVIAFYTIRQRGRRMDYGRS